nr:DnaJ domain-containing protein [Methyloversatilis sp.]
MEFKDYYQILGVPRDATAEEIKKAFRKLARKYHPDVSREADAETRMQELNEANAVLSDPEKRAAYDQLGRGYQPGQEFQPPPDWDAGFEFSGRGFSPGEAGDFSDFFAELFGRPHAAHGFSAGQRAHFQARGEDHHAKVMLDLEDAFTGATRQISLRAPRTDAQGRVVLENRTLNVRIPQGVHAGQVIRLAGQGAPGIGGAPAGDLMLEVRFRPHPRFRVQGRDLHLTLPVAPWEAALGAVVAVDLPQGSVKV